MGCTFRHPLKTLPEWTVIGRQRQFLYILFRPRRQPVSVVIWLFGFCVTFLFVTMTVNVLDHRCKDMAKPVYVAYRPIQWRSSARGRHATAHRF